MDLGTGIVTGCAVLGGVQILLKFVPNSNKGQNQRRAEDGMVTEKLCDSRFELVSKAVSEGLEGLRGDIQALHKRIDRAFEQK